MRNRISTVAVVIASTLGVAACDRGTPTLPTGPAPPERTYLVAGTVRDPSGSPVGDARVEVIAGPLLGSVTTTDQEGRFGFPTPIPLSTAPTLQVTKDGYRPATVPSRPHDAFFLRLIPIEFPDLGGAYAVTVQAASNCSQIPASLRSRTYSASIDRSARYEALFTGELTGAIFQPGYDTFSGNLGLDSVRFFFASWDAFEWWLEDQPIIEQLNPDGHLSVFGTATARVTTGTPITAAFDGTWSYCPASAPPGGLNWPLMCRVQPVECRSTDHQLTLSRR